MSVRNSSVLIVALPLLVLSALALSSLPGYAQESDPRMYVVKFICGDADTYDASGLDLNNDGVIDTGQFIARGEYHTVINVHNPNTRYVNMFKKIALDGYRMVQSASTGLGNVVVFNPPRPRFLYQVPGPIFYVNIVDGITPPLHPNFDPDGDGLPRYFSMDPVAIRLSPDETFQINCPEIRAVVNDWTLRSLPARPDADGDGDREADDVNAQGDFRDAFLIKGYFVIFAERPLDVTAIYTACPEGASPNALDCGLSAGVTSIDVEEIKPNPVPPPDRLVPERPAIGLSLSTAGTARELRIDLKVSRFTALAQARLLVYSTDGQLLHDTGFKAGTQLRWRPLMNGRPLANGVYLYVVQMKDVFGRIGTKVGKFALMR